MTTSARERLFELDSLRGIAAIGVVLWHYTAMWQVRPMNWLFAPFYNTGLLLVDFFFVLSGFVIARAYWNNERGTTFLKNIFQRIARIYPLHLITLLSVIPLQLTLIHLLGPLDYLFLNNDVYHFALNLFLLNRSSLEIGFSWNSPAWSISTEMIINFVFFALIAMGKKVSVIGMVACFLIAAFVITKNGLLVNERLFGVINADIMRTTAGFFIGVATYKLSNTKILKSITNSFFADFVFMIAVTLLVLFMVYARVGLVRPEHVAFTLFPIIVLSAISSRAIKSILNAKVLVTLGEWSYSIYLVHFPILLATLLISTVASYKFPYESTWFVIAFLGVVVLISSVTYRVIEIPGKRLLSKKLSFVGSCDPIRSQ
ncbi:acyltransferase [Pseudomonas sp. SWRI74]|uniref:Acyltransferase n=1 Tax=Pseudomonas azerbaijanoccidentalis TaxID=2842347 RepID=A0ABS6QY40_9PSED|nr:acyltransferase [Pseudomonas azerbaijanoccidentalis]MBV4523852.1 acyltransferase [Pseudomonas azerbaijanoccidentalis]